MSATYQLDDDTLVVETIEQAAPLEALGWELVDGERPEAPVPEGDVVLEREPFDPIAQGVTGAEVAEELERILADADAYVAAADAEVDRIVEVESTRQAGPRREVKAFLEALADARSSSDDAQQ